MYRIMFLGQKPIGEMCFDILVSRQSMNIEISAIVSNSSTENVWWNSDKPHQYAMSNGLRFIGNESRNTDKIKECIKEKDINLLISVGHKWIIDKETLDLVDGNAINLHLAPLPMYQGNFTFNHAILNHDKQYGVTLHFMQEQVDTGDYIYMPRFDIEKKDTAYSLYSKSIKAGVKAFEDFIVLLANGEDVPRNKMTGTAHFYDRHSIDGQREIRDISDQNELLTKARAFYFPPFESAYFWNEGLKYYITPEVLS